MSFVDPTQFVITRKRKKYRFALFNNSNLCFEYDEWEKRKVDVLEIGAGTGTFSVELSALNPQLFFVALDVKGDRLQKGAIEATKRGLTNVFFVRARADQITEMFDEESLKSIWLTFSDPFSKKGQAGRRLTHPNFLRKYNKLLRSDGELLIKHDNQDFFEWSLEQLVAEKYHINLLSFDLHDSDLDDNYKIMTTYEQRWLNEDRKIYFSRNTKPIKAKAKNEL